MYIHLGQETLVKKNEIIGIFDLPKSFIVCQHKKEIKIYISQISTSTLLKRSETDFENSLY